MEMLELIKEGNQKKVIDAMIQGQSQFGTYEKIERDIDFKADAIKVRFPDEDYRDVVIRIEVFLNKMLDLNDEFALRVNEVLYNLGYEDDFEKVLEILEEQGCEIDKAEFGNGYTYNFDNFLSRDIIYHMFKHDGEVYSFIQVHHGADARWGFGDAVCFKVIDDYEFMHGMDINAWDSGTDEDINVWELSDIADYDKELNEWRHKETGNEIYLTTSANGW